MSMNNSAASGHLIKASELTPLLPKPLQEQYARLVEDKDFESVEALLSDHMPKGFPPFDSIFVFSTSAGMECEDLEDETMYVSFADEDLFTKTPTKALKAMQQKKVGPAFIRWVVWG